MSLDAPAGNLPTARLDIRTWTYYPAPPSAVDADLDRKTDRLFTTARVVQWMTAVFVVGFLLPALLGLVALPLVALVGGVCALAASIVTGLWHQQLRKRTGIPIIPVLESSLEPFAAMLREYQQAYELVLADDPNELSQEDAQDLRDLQTAARKAQKSQREMTRVLSRQFIAHCELAAQADRRGWKRLRDRHARTVANWVVRVARTQEDDNDDAAHTDEDGKGSGQ